MSTASNLAVSIVAGVAVMFIWQQIQKAQAKKLANDQNEIDHGGTQYGKTGFGQIFAPDWAQEAVVKMKNTNGVYDITDGSNRTYYA
jgi:hypothetical protein